ncbi:MAG: hypothetical protein IT370_38000 [Deltaproteobacteria bacterium]|nr:hypothetical protein [Deltaproteobacteria bacterium]
MLLLDGPSRPALALLAVLLEGCGDDLKRPADAGRADAGADSALPDAAASDAALPDSALPDAALPDAATVDAMPADAAPPGLLSWTIRGPESTTVDSAATAIAWDSTGALWVAGIDTLSALDSAGWVRRLDLGGGPSWTHRVDVAGTLDSFRGIAADGSGQAVAVGRSGPNLVRKFDSAGNVLWTAADTATGIGRRNEDVLAGGGGTWVVAGSTAGLEFAGLIRYSATGSPTAFNSLSTNVCDSSVGLRLAHASGGDWFYGGYTCSSEFGAPSFLRRTDGNLTTRFDGFDALVPSVEGVAFLGDELLVCSPGSLDRYSATGVLIRRHPLSGSCKRIATTPAGTIVVAEAAPDGSARVSTLSSTGSQLWQHSYRGAANLGATPADLDIGSDGTIYVTGSELTAGKSIFFVAALTP